jgi:hypothetical protein
VPEAPQHQQGHQQPPQQSIEDPPGAEGRERPPHPGQPRSLQPAKPPDHGVVDDRHVHGHTAQPTGEDHDRQRDQYQGGDQPPDPAGLDVVRQRRRLPGGPPPACPPHRRRRSRLRPKNSRWCRPVRGQVHGPSQPGETSRPDDLVGWLPPCQGHCGCGRPPALVTRRWSSNGSAQHAASGLDGPCAEAGRNSTWSTMAGHPVGWPGRWPRSDTTRSLAGRRRRRLGRCA